MQAILLCGGLATRLGETAKTIPKILLNIDGKTVLEWQLQLLKDVNAQEVILASGHRHDVLSEHAGSYYGGLPICYAKEENRLGTGGAIANAMRQIHTFPFFVLNGDILLANFSLREMLKCFHQEMVGLLLLLLSVRVDDIRPYGEIVADGDGKITAFREKQSTRRSGYINSGVYIFNQTIANAFPTEQDFFSIERDVFPNVRDLYTLQANAKWIDIGVPERLSYRPTTLQNGDLR